MSSFAKQPNLISLINQFEKDLKELKRQAVKNSELASGVSEFLVPTGAVIPYAGDTAPTGWLLCDGNSFSASLYPALFSVIGTTYGALFGNPRLPDLRTRVPVGKAASGTFGSLGNTGGSETHTLTTAQIPAHNHDVSVTYAQASNTATSGSGNRSSIPQTGSSSTFTSTNTGGGGAHNNLQPYIVLNYIIKT